MRTDTHLSEQKTLATHLLYRLQHWALALGGAALVAACGGGGGGSSVPAPSVLSNVPTVSGLKISEVSACFYSSVGCWLEVYNPGATPVSLAGYSLAAPGLPAVGGTATDSTFALPALTVPAKGYVVVAGNPSGVAQRGTQVAMVGSPALVPYWNSTGYIALVNNARNAFEDAVLLGAGNSVAETYWNGPGVAGLTNIATGYSRSVVRSYQSIDTTDTQTAKDWIVVDFATPGGRNDVPANATDADLDGVPDSAEASGSTFGGMNLYAMGARTGQKDLFLEVDRMTSADPGVSPREEALQKLVAAFNAQGVKVHIDAGTQFSATFDPARFNLGQGSNEVAYEKCVDFDGVTCTANTANGRRSLWDWKREYADVRRLPVFHYTLFANSQNSTGSAGSSGRAEINGNDLVVTLGSWNLNANTTSDTNTLINWQASTLMHELGHNLGLLHGGSEDVNYKPNYYSVMNYAYQLAGLDANSKSSLVYVRWMLSKGQAVTGYAAYCSLPNSPCGTGFVMNYSDGSGNNINEAAVLESANIGRGIDVGAYADWNKSGVLNTAAYAFDFDGDGSGNKVLADHNDWANIKLAFMRNYTANTGALLEHSRAPLAPSHFDPVTNDRQPVAEEFAPPAQFFDALRAGR